MFSDQERRRKSYHRRYYFFIFLQMSEFTLNHVQLQLSFVFDCKENFVSIFEDQETDF